jgi:hypothetical protein
MSVPTLAFSVFDLLSLNCPYDTVDLAGLSVLLGL